MYFFFSSKMSRLYVEAIWELRKSLHHSKKKGRVTDPFSKFPLNTFSKLKKQEI